jgi:hypothetical protein
MQVGLLRERHMDYFPVLCGVYKSENHLHSAAVIKASFCFEVTVEFLGVWQVPTF